MELIAPIVKLLYKPLVSQTNTLAYLSMELIAPIVSLMIQAPVFLQKRASLLHYIVKKIYSIYPWSFLTRQFLL
jgi:hypothetical protein